MPPKKTPAPVTPAPLPNRLPWFQDGDETDPAFPFHVEGITVRRPKGTLRVSLVLAWSLNGLPESGWPDALKPLRSMVARSMADDGPVWKQELHPKADVFLTLSTLTGGVVDPPLIDNHLARVAKVAIVAKPGDALLRVTFQLEGAKLKFVGALVEHALGSSVVVSTEKQQRNLFPPDEQPVVQ